MFKSILFVPANKCSLSIKSTAYSIISRSSSTLSASEQQWEPNGPVTPIWLPPKCNLVLAHLGTMPKETVWKNGQIKKRNTTASSYSVPDLSSAKHILPIAPINRINTTAYPQETKENSPELVRTPPLPHIQVYDLLALQQTARFYARRGVFTPDGDKC